MSDPSVSLDGPIRILGKSTVTMLTGPVETARNLTKGENMPLSVNHYLKNMGKLTNQWTSLNYKERDRQRIYLKDIDCPQVWHDKLKDQIPPAVFYLNDSTGEPGGPGALAEPNNTASGSRKGRGIGPAGDLMSSLPPAMRAENMMCYIGHEGTYTPAHREMCASLGQNIMVETSGTVDDDGQPCKPGSSIWFMTETKDRHLVSEYWLSILGHDIEVEAHFAQINAWRRAPFTTYVVEQKAGDFLLIPPLAPHQVWNRGTRTMKAAWNRTTVETLEMALEEALPRARMVCRDEQYKNKAIVLFTLQRYSTLLKRIETQKQSAKDQDAQLELAYSTKIRQLQKDFKRLFTLYTKILLSEMLAPVPLSEKRGQYIPYDSNITCSYCRCNIFNRFLTCPSCIIPYGEGEEDTYDICMECFVMGRSCKCISKLKWVEQFPWQDLIQKHEVWRKQIITFEGGESENSPLPLQVVRKRSQKKPLAQICQEQLKIRPWRDPKKDHSREIEEQSLDDDDVREDGTVKKKKKKRSEKWLKETLPCHICKHRETRWKLAICSCGTPFCYGTLWRGFDMLPQVIMEDPDWKCPRCLKICSCKDCIKDPENKPFEPTGTILGHDTKKIADHRSTESLVNFSHSNMLWLKKAGDDHPLETRRLQRRRNEAELAKSRDPTLDNNYVEGDVSPVSSGQSNSGILYDQTDEIPIDPQLSNVLVGSSTVQPSRNTTSNHRQIQTPSSVSINQDTTGNPKQSRLDPNVSNQRTRIAAVEALAAMNSMSQLEMNPDAFRFAAGLNTGQDPYAAPFAQMVDSGQRENGYRSTGNGGDYEYPDPSLQGPQLQDSHLQNSQPQGAQSQPPEIRNTDVIMNGGQKRKRGSGLPSIQSDLEPQGDANAQFQKLQIQRTLAEARRKGQYTMAEAAISGKSLVLKLPVSGARLTRSGNPVFTDEQVSESSGAALNESKETNLLQSDFPANAAVVTAQTKDLNPPKKRLAREENDQTFTSRLRHQRRSSIVDNVVGRRKSKALYREVSEGPEPETDVDNAESLELPTITKKILTAEIPPSDFIVTHQRFEGDELVQGLPKRSRGRPPRNKQSDPRRNSSNKPAPAPANPTRLLEPQSAPAAVLDAAAGKEVSTPRLDLDLSALGAGANDLSDSTFNGLDSDNDGKNTGSFEDANRKAKMKAMDLSQPINDTYESGSEDDTTIKLTTSKKPKVVSKKTSEYLSPGDEFSSPNNSPKKPSPKAVRRSMFSKPGAKFRVISVKAASGKQGTRGVARGVR